jgi:predicted nucleotide-binding protein
MSGITKLDALEKLLKLADEASRLEASYFNSPSFKKWRRDTSIALNRIFGENSRHSNEFGEITYEYPLVDSDADDDKWSYEEGLSHASALLQSMADEVRDYWDDKLLAPAETNNENLIRPRINPCVFIGHGRNLLWARLQLFLEKELKLKTVNYESESRAGEAIVTILERMLEESSFAVLILSAEDATASGVKRARQNVVHEAGLFQGRLGFNKAILLVQEGLEEFSNLAGLQHISFSGERIEHTFHELRRVLEREGLVSGFRIAD